MIEIRDAPVLLSSLRKIGADAKQETHSISNLPPTSPEVQHVVTHSSGIFRKVEDMQTVNLNLSSNTKCNNILPLGEKKELLASIYTKFCINWWCTFEEKKKRYFCSCCQRFRHGSYSTSELFNFKICNII